MLNIVSIPHQALRTQAQPITELNKKTIKFLKNLGQTLEQKKNPKGVGLAAPQVDKAWRAFVINVNDDPTADENTSAVETFINPIITKRSQKHTMGPKRDETLEGCLSMEGYYGPVPRWEWVEVEYQVIQNSNNSNKAGSTPDQNQSSNPGGIFSKNNTTPSALQSFTKKFSGFKARVIQHELDHLDGILFTDYSLEYNLPVYLEKGSKLVEIEDRSILENY